MNTATRQLWESGAGRELGFWRQYLASEGLDWPDEFRWRFDPSTTLQSHIAAMLPQDLPVSRLTILDCAAGPATTLGKTLHGERLPIVTLDALAGDYQQMLAELRLSPPLPSIRCEVEQLDTLFPPSQFELVYMRFALDHCYDPIAGLRQMIRVARPGCAVMIEHYRGDHDDEYQGLKHWTLVPTDDDLLIGNRALELSVKQKLPDVDVEVRASPTWLTLVLRKPET